MSEWVSGAGRGVDMEAAAARFAVVEEALWAPVTGGPFA
jgi:hypothetical protein